ncbi:MAG: hypothetical protein V4671_15055 [Armatimonadota bacterium]
MKIIIKPLGAAFLLIAIGVLAVLAFRGASTPGPESASAPVVVSNTTPDTAAAAPSSGSLPGPSASSPSNQSVRGHSIYRDGVENGWEAVGWTWAKDVSYDDTTRPRSGTRAIRVRYTNFDGVKFHHAPLNTSPFDRISFYINGGETGGQKIAVGAACSEKNVSDGTSLAPLPPKKWVAVTIPLDKISLAKRPDMTSFWIQGSSDKPQPTVYIDEVRLLKSGEPAPSGESLPLAK